MTKASCQMAQKTQKIRITVRLQPRASRDELPGRNDEGTMRARVKAAPADGAANAALLKLLARRLGIAKSKVSLVSGARARNKIVEIEGVTEAVIRKIIRHEGRLK